MSETELETKIVRITVDQGEAGLFYATSPDLAGLLVAEHSVEALESAIPEAIGDLYAACGEKVFVIPANDYSGQHSSRAWVKVPAQIAQNALAAMEARHTG